MAKIKMSKAQSVKTFSKDSTALARGGENTVNRINEKYSKSRIGDMGPAGRKEAMSKVKDYVDTKRPKLVGYKDDNKDYGPKDKKGNYRFAPMEDYKRGGKVKTAKKMADGGKVKSFPDLNKDGKITKADILKGRGVIAKHGTKMMSKGRKMQMGGKCKNGC